MKFAWIEGGKVRDVAQGDPAALFHPDVAQHYNTQVPDTAASGDAWDGSTLTKPEPVAPQAPAPAPKTLTRVQFMLLFTPAERVAIRAAVAAGTDAVLVDWWSILQDSQFDGVILGSRGSTDALSYLVAKGLLTAPRKAAVLAGEEP